MKFASKNKILSAFILVLLTGIFLLQKSKLYKSPGRVSSLSTNQEKPQIANVKTSVFKQELESIEPATETSSHMMKPASNIKADKNLTASLDDFEDFVLDGIGDDLRKKLGREVFEIEGIDLIDHPNSITFEFKPELGRKSEYRLFSKNTDENDNVIDGGPLAQTNDGGYIKYEVISVDNENNTYTIKESSGGDFIQAGNNFRVNVGEMPSIENRIFTYNKDGSLVKATDNGLDVTSLFKTVSRLVFPQKDLRVGDKWTCGGEPDSTWKIEASIDSFVQISGHKCVAVSFKEEDEFQSEELDNKWFQLKRSGKYYYDYETMLLVRKEYIESMDGEFAPGIDRFSCYIVMNISETK